MSQESSLIDLETELDVNDKVVVFMLGRERFALSMQSVQEIIRPQKTIRVPMSRPTLIGLSNLRGRVLPIFDTHQMLGLPRAELSESSRALVVGGLSGSSQALLVDRVIAVQDFDDSQVDWDIQSIETDVQSSWLQGLLRHDGEIIMLMDSAYLDKALVGAQSTESVVRATIDSLDSSDEDDILIADELQLVTLELNSQAYGLPIECVREILHCPEKLIEVPGCRSELLGVTVLRDRLLPLISLRILFGLNQPKLEKGHRVVVVELGDGIQVGLVIDRMREVLTVNKSDLEPVPTLVADQVRFLNSICRPAKGEHVISLIDLPGLFNNIAQQAMAACAEIGHEFESKQVDEEKAEMDGDDDSQWVLFRLDEEEFGVPITSVKEIVRVPEKMNRVPRGPANLDGVINLRGKVLPVFDQKKRMGMGISSNTERQRIMVYQLHGLPVGFKVDSVSRVIRIDPIDIEPAPQSANDTEGLIVSVAKLDKDGRMVMLIDPSKLLDTSDVENLSQVDPEVNEERNCVVDCKELSQKEGSSFNEQASMA